MATESANVDAPVSATAALEAKVASLEAAVAKLMEGVRDPTEDAPASGSKVKKPRAKSAYNVFMSEELARLKVSEPTSSHQERFAKAVRTWQKMKEPSEPVDESDAKE
jgi:predicted RNA-binding Zn ribbon-like protein